ncbi:MAG: thymidine phosphorylase [Armatimonadota bacterium]
MRMLDIIRKKRDGLSLSAAEIDFVVSGVTSGSIPDYQTSALLMAIVLNGMTDQETADLTASMAHSGEVLAWDDPFSIIDKHSTGGVGDKTSLIVVPILMACGIHVCKMSGRGLGHTGGTLDKLEAIPGLSVNLTSDQLQTQTIAIGAALAGQSKSLAPADGILYALRDVTGTVESTPLIVASILSKKLAGGAGNLIFDVKVGDGAFMPTLPAARNLADALIRIAKLHGKRVEALITDMDQPLGKMAGNALELIEVVQMLNPAADSKPDRRLQMLCVTLATNALMLAANITEAEASTRVLTALDSGAAFTALKSIIGAQGGDTRVLDDTSLLPAAPVVRDVTATTGGYICRIPARTIGDAVVQLGGGRAVKTDVIDHRVGIETLVHIGDAIRPGDTLFRVHATTDDAASDVAELLINAIGVSDVPVAQSPVVIERRV